MQQGNWDIKFEKEMTLEEYKKYRVGILKELYIRLSDEQMEHLNSLNRHNEVDAFLRDIILNSEQNDKPSVRDRVNKVYNKQIVNDRRAKINAAKRVSR